MGAPAYQQKAIDCAFDPVFVHSLWRNSSTYVFNVFRKSSRKYVCYQESIHELLFLCRENSSLLTAASAADTHSLRHPPLDEDYFAEAQRAHSHWSPFVNKSMLYDEFFTLETSSAVESFFRGLIAASPRQPIFQECRSVGRMPALKRALGGRHIFLLRNPWDQWWSFKINDYFNTAMQLVLNAEPHPGIIAFVRDRNGFQPFHSPDLHTEFEHFRQRPMSSQQSYRAFFALWASALLQALTSADLIIDMDRLSASPAYRDVVIGRLAGLGLDHLSFDDCRTPCHPFQLAEREFYEQVEDEVFGALIADGADSRRVEQLKIALSRRWRNRPGDEKIDGLAQARAIALRHADELQAMSHRAHDGAKALEASKVANETLATALESGERARIDLENRIVSVEDAAHQEAAMRAETERKLVSLAALAAEQADRAQAGEQALRAEIADKDLAIEQRDGDAHRLAVALADMEARVATMRRTLSWRATAPFRFVARRLRLWLRR